MMYCSKSLLSSFKFVSSVILSSSFLVACGGSSSSTQSQQLEQELGSVELLYPLSPVATSGDTFKVRGSLTENVENIEVNGIDVDTTSYAEAGYWVADLPIEYGDNPFSITYESNGEEFEVDGHTISRRSILSNDIKTIAHHSITGEYYAIISDINSLVKYSADGREVDTLHQFSIEHYPNNAEDDNEANERNPEALWLSADNTMLYMYVERDNDQHIYTYELATGEINEVYSPSSPSYVETNQSSDFAPLVALNRGASGLVYFFPQFGHDAVYTFDLASHEMALVDIPHLETVVSASKSEYYSLGLKNDNTAVVLAYRTDSTKYPFSTEIDLSACDAAMGPCSLSFANTVANPTIETGCPTVTHYSARSHFHSGNHSFVINNDENICAYDIASNEINNLTNLFNRYEELRQSTPDTQFVNNELWISTSSSFDNRAAYYPLDDDYDRYQSYPNFAGSIYTIGNALIQPQTPREVITDEANQRLFWIDRNNGGPINAEVHEWSAKTNTWRNVGDYPANSFEQGIYNPVDGKLYIVDENNFDQSIFAVDPEDGSYEVIIGTSEWNAVGYTQDLNPVLIALDETKQQLYIASDVSGSTVPVNYSWFTLHRWDLNTQSLSEVSPLAPYPSDGNNLRAEYLLEFDEDRGRLYFKRDSQDELWTVDVQTGEPALFSEDDDVLGPDLNNNRGTVIDVANNRLIGTSQDHESLFATDLDSGVRTMISPDADGYGIGFLQSKGIDIFAKTQIAFVADERIDALYQVDLVTGQRAIMQNQALR